MDQFVLFGDSITQQSFAQERGFAFGAELANQYVRRLDVINSGFSGYNTSQALKTVSRASTLFDSVTSRLRTDDYIKVLPKILPSPDKARIRFLTIFFGANDARLPDTPGPSQTVSIEAYKLNLISIITHPAVKTHKDLRIILITPPPIDERLQGAQDHEKYPDFTGLRRTSKNTAAYAGVVRDVGREMGVVVLDLWSSMMAKAGWKGGDGPLPGSKDLPQNEVLVDFLHDGLHLNPSAYKVLYDDLMELIKKTWPDQIPERLPMMLPAWDDPQAWK